MHGRGVHTPFAPVTPRDRAPHRSSSMLHPPSHCPCRPCAKRRRRGIARGDKAVFRQSRPVLVDECSKGSAIVFLRLTLIRHLQLPRGRWTIDRMTILTQVSRSACLPHRGCVGLAPERPTPTLTECGLGRGSAVDSCRDRLNPTRQPIRRLAHLTVFALAICPREPV